MSEIIGITGAIGSGKTTLSNLLVQLEPDHALYESSQLVAEVADDFNAALKGELAFETTNNEVELVNQALIWFTEAIVERLHHDVTWNQLAITKQQLTTHPELFEKLFVYLTLVKTQSNLLSERITKENKTTYRPLLQWIGGYLVAKISPTIWFEEIFRRIGLHDSDKKLIVINGMRYPAQAEFIQRRGGKIIEIIRPGLVSDTHDITEASRAQITPDIRVINNGTPEDLQKIAEKLWLDLSVGKVDREYRASK